jgi:hypothetical protein
MTPCWWAFTTERTPEMVEADPDIFDRTERGGAVYVIVFRNWHSDKLIVA